MKVASASTATAGSTSTSDAEAIAAVRASRPSKLFLLPWNPTAENMARYLLEVVCPGVLADLELELQLLADGRRARSADELHDVLRRVGDLATDQIDLRCEGSQGALEWVISVQ